MNSTLTYHPDHLGTGTLITDRNGEPYPFFLNLPYGETLLEQGGYRYDNPYKFNSLSQLDKVGSKELDKETGLYYYGARYYDPAEGYFLSVDPLAEKYYFQSPCVYAENNPVVFRDINGEGTEEWDDR
jgi:RHS repeat-associated protein